MSKQVPILMMKVAAILSVVMALSSCGGGGDGGGVPRPVDPTPGLRLPMGHGLMAGQITVAAGTSEEHGSVVVTCPAGGDACVVTVAADGTAVYDRTGSVPSVMPVMGTTPVDQVPIDLDKYLTEGVAQGRSPGLFAAVIDHEGVRAIGAAGVRRQGSTEEITANDLVHLGSLTKAMTSTMLATLVDDGTFPNGWRTTIAEVFPDLAQEIHEGYHSVELSQLVRMQGGIRRDAENWWSHPDNPDVVGRRYEIIKDNLTEAPAGHVGEYLYSNLSYVIAGAMAERLTGKSWEILMEERIFGPLGMATAGFGSPGSPGTVDQPWGHRRGQGGAWVPNQRDNNPALGPAGTVHSSIEDWAKFIGLWFANETPAILDRTTLNELITPGAQNYAAGWWVVQRDWAGGTALTHGGSNLNWLAVLWIAPNRGFAILTVANGAEDDLDTTSRFLDSIVSRLIVNEAPETSVGLVGGGSPILKSTGADFAMIAAANADADVTAKAAAAVMTAAQSDVLISGSHLAQGEGAPTELRATYGVDGPTLSLEGYSEVGEAKRTSRGHRGRELSKITTDRAEDGSTLVRTSYVAAYADIEAPTALGDDITYLTWGFWIRLEDDSSTGSGVDVVGAGTFVEGTQVIEPDSITVLTGVAHYEGEAAGLYADQNGVRYFDARASLTADFGDVDVERHTDSKGGEVRSAGKIWGTVSEFNIGGTATEGTIILGGGRLKAIGDDKASIDATSATFAGNTFGNLAGHTFDHTPLTGWGGRFFAADSSGQPEYVAGTFGASSHDDGIALVGAFGASRQAEE